MGQRKSGHVTLLDIARASGFSVSTVSIVLSSAPLSQNVAATTREHIRTISQQLGYHPMHTRAPCAAVARSPSGFWDSISLTPFASLSCAESRPVCARPESSPHGRCTGSAEAIRQLAAYDPGASRRRCHRNRKLGIEETNLLADVKKNNVPIVIVAGI